MKTWIFIICMLCTPIFTMAQQTTTTESKQKKANGLFVKVKDQAQPDVYIDGKKYDADIIDLLDPNKIKSINIVKDETAIEKYNAPNGVILIESKKTIANKPVVETKNQESWKKSQPKIIINDKPSTQERLEGLSPDSIVSIKVIKDAKGKEKYNAPNGVIMIITKEEKNK